MLTKTEVTVTAAQKAQFDQDGFLVLRGFYSPVEIAEIKETFMAQNASGPVPGLSDINSSFTPDDPLSFYPRMMNPHRHPEIPVGPMSYKYLLDARVGTVLEQLMGEEPLAAQTMFYFKPAGARGQELHQDNFYLRVAPGTCYAAWTAIDDADVENGGMVVVPGSNQLGIFCPEKADLTQSFTSEYVPIPQGLEAVPTNLKAGDVLFFNGSVIHGSTPNTSKERFRRAFICHYVPRSSEELSQWYRPLLAFDEATVEIEAATGGGPCGVAEPMGRH